VGPADLRRFAAPAAFLLAATIAVVAIRAGLGSGGGTTTSARVVPAVPRKHVATTTGAATTRRKPPARRYWTVQAGDTFGVISSKTGVPVTTIQRLNPGASSTTLTIGEKIRIR
jgi:LysM repeat protein